MKDVNELLKTEKRNIINLVEYHRKHCNGECVVSLNLLRKTAERRGIKFTDEEKELFL